MYSDIRYLELMKKSLTNTLYPEPPISIDIFNYLRPLHKRIPITIASTILKRFGLRLCLERNLFGTDRSDGRVWREYADTLIGIKRLDNIQYCVNEVLKNNIEGDLLEAGVWRGGACVFMKAILDTYKDNRKVFVADSFEGMPKPDTERYPLDKGNAQYDNKSLKVSQNDVAYNFEKYGLLDDNVMFLKGWFKDTLPIANIDKLSVLRVDCDMYSSTMDVLKNLYGKLSVGGFCIVDDYNAIVECKKAVDDFILSNKLKVKKQEIDWTGIFWKKE